MSNLKIYIIGLLIVTNIVLSFAIVWTKHLTRTQYRILQSLSNQKYNLKTEWRKARVEKGKYDSLSKIEKDAQIFLNMTAPKKRELIYIYE